MMKWLQRILSGEEGRSLREDIEEIYAEIKERKGGFRAGLWLGGQILTGLPRWIQHRGYWSVQMFINDLRIAARNLSKRRMFSLINITGLTIGLTAFILIGLFVRHELGFDGFHARGDRIFRVIQEGVRNGEPFLSAPTVLPLAPALKAEFPEVERAARIAQRSSCLVSTGERHFYQSILFADPEIFDILTLPLVRGDADRALARPGGLVLTREAAEKYFGREDPIGRTMSVDGRPEYTVTAILEDIPDGSHLRIQMMGSIQSIRAREGARWTSWDHRSNDYTYLLLRAGVDPAGLEARFPAFLRSHMEKEGADRTALHLQPLREVHFTELAYDMARTYSRTYLLALSAIGAFILMIAALNFMNLATAQSTVRAREVGMRKVVGARRGQLIRQFLTESVLTSAIAALAAVGLVFALLSWYRVFVGREIEFRLFGDPWVPAVLAGVALATGLASGSYPAFLLSAFHPSRTLSGRIGGSGIRRFSLRTVFVVLQFAVSIILITATLVVFRQLDFLRQKDLGFRSDQVLMIPLRESPLRKNAEAFRARLEHHPRVQGVTLASGMPGSGSSQTSNFHVETPEGEREVYLSYITTDHEFIRTFGMSIIDGRDFSREFSTDAGGAAVVNQTAARRMGWESPIGKTIRRGGDGPRLRIIGVVRDFHYDSPHSRIEPMAVFVAPRRPEYLAVRVDAAHIDDLLPELKSIWREGAPNYPFEYFFADREFERSYRFDRRVGEMFSVFALLAISISCLGVFGLISYTVERSTKEIGVRKVLGASAAGIVRLLSLQFVRWILAANLIAWPVAWLVMRRWLQGFAYRIDPGPVEFLAAAGLALLIALATILNQALRAARADPSRSLRYE